MNSNFTEPARVTKRSTILDVARTAGVSKSTVSLVLQRSPLVKDTTVKRVREAMAEVDYVYNRAAANLRRNNVGLIGLIINDLRNPFFTEFAASVQMSLSSRNYATILSNTDEDPRLQDSVVGSMIEHGVSAFIISPTYDGESKALDQVERAGIPAIQVLRNVDDRSDRFPFASFDYVEGGRQATSHLREVGARSIAFVGGVEDRPITVERAAGYLQVLESNGDQPEMFLGRATRIFGYETANKLARHHPDIDAAICFNDLVAHGMISGFNEIGISVGHDFRLVGFDDIEESSLSWPKLTSVHCDIASFGRRMASSILGWLEDGILPPRNYSADVKLIKRTSTLGWRVVS